MQSWNIPRLLDTVHNPRQKAEMRIIYIIEPVRIVHEKEKRGNNKRTGKVAVRAPDTLPGLHEGEKETKRGKDEMRI
jgi:hypothetical protein